MAAVGLSVWLVERIKPSLTSGPDLQQLNLNVEKDENQEILQQLLVREAMNKSPLMLPGSMLVLQAGLALTSDRCRSALVIDEAEDLVGIITLEDINRAIAVWEQYRLTASTTASESQRDSAFAKLYASFSEADSNLPSFKLSDICTTEILYAYTDEPLSEALDRMAARGLHQLPVIERGNREQVLGLLERDQIALTCKVAATHQALHRYLPVTPKTEKLPLATLKKPTF
jgi:CBS domain-containing protein